MIRLKTNGDFVNTRRYFERVKQAARINVLEKYAQAGVNALVSATPKDSGMTASSWYYTIKRQNGKAVIEFCNSHVNKGVNIAIILQYGHGTGTGGYVAGRDYINPAIQPIFDKLVEDAWKEVTSI